MALKKKKVGPLSKKSVSPKGRKSGAVLKKSIARKRAISKKRVLSENKKPVSAKKSVSLEVSDLYERARWKRERREYWRNRFRKILANLSADPKAKR
ncbi:MAG TPA: hypothetical protein VIK48_04505 [Candidatus Manganitrophaceae bacterium]|nr:hypothetical protein [Candidatus Manganitrophaceae bacterium]